MCKNLKLFVWEGVLCDYTCGMICVLASSEQEAFDLLYEKDSIAWSQMMGLWNGKGWNDPEITALSKEYKGDLCEIQKLWMKNNKMTLMEYRIKPKVIEKPEAFTVHGGS